jgi:phosphate transport system permease protein
MTSHPRPLTRQRPATERIIESLLFLAAALGVVTTLGIVLVLVFETLEFFREVNPIDFFTGTFWSASIQPRAWGVLALVSGTILVAGIALIIAIPLGLLSAVLLSDYAPPRARTLVKPILETLAGIPTIVLGFFAVNVISPQLLIPILG